MCNGKIEDMSDISPEIAALLAESNLDFDTSPVETENKAQNGDSKSGYGKANNAANSVDLTKTKFAPVEKFIADTPITQVYSDKAYYKTTLTDEPEVAQRLHSLLSKYLTCKDPKDRAIFRQQIVTPYWEVLRSISQKAKLPSTPECKKMLLRFGILLPSLMTDEQKDIFSRSFRENTSGEPIYYLDEWFSNIAQGLITISATDEAKPRSKGAPAGSSEETARLMQLKTKAQGKVQNAETMLAAKESERQSMENGLKGLLDDFCYHPQIPGTKHKECLSEVQKKKGNDIAEKVRLLVKIDREISQYLVELEEANETSKHLDEKLALAGNLVEVNNADFMTEFDTVRQMAKMSVGRMGNHFPIFTKEFFHCIPKGIGFRENVIREMAWVESLDPGVFCRIHKNVMNRIVPYVILIPTYGDFGFCWEPFDRFNRVTSRGRIIVPMYPKNLQHTILLACADLRWQVAKEKASYYWMEEGLTGQYYQWFTSQKLKGDVKEKFIEDYILWIKFESEGMMKLDKEVRGIFWRHMPFPQERKEMLKTRSLVYQELYQRDINRSMSDGY